MRPGVSPPLWPSYHFEIHRIIGYKDFAMEVRIDVHSGYDRAYMTPRMRFPARNETMNPKKMGTMNGI